MGAEKKIVKEVTGGPKFPRAAKFDGHSVVNRGFRGVGNAFRNVILIVFVFLLTVTLARPAAAQYTATYAWLQANARATFNSASSSGVALAQPFEGSFIADRVIAIYDSDGDGVIDAAPNSTFNNSHNPNEVFPFSLTPNGAISLGRRIGSPFEIDGVVPRPFCGDILVYAEEDVNGKTAFVWFAFQDPARAEARRANPGSRFCGDWGIDFGAGILNGDIHHATYVGGFLFGAAYECLNFRAIAAGTIASPGSVLSAPPSDPQKECINPPPPNISTSMPYPMASFRAAEPGIVALNNLHFIDLTNVVIDVPLIREEAWDGRSFFQRSSFGRRIFSLSGGQSFGAAASSSATLWTSAFSDSAGPLMRDQYLSIKLADVTGDGRDDLCAREVQAPGSGGFGGIMCAASTGSSFGTLSRWTNAFEPSWSGDEAYWGTIQYPDVSGDGKADVCGRGSAGIYCGISNGASFGPVTLWDRSSAFSDANGWASHPSYWKTIRFPDLNKDGKADVCGRGSGGIYCALSNGTSFDPVRPWSSVFSDANGWNTDPSYWSTIQFADVDGDPNHYPDVCGRGIAGIYCGISNGTSFGPVTLWLSAFSDTNGWNTDPSYWSTIQFADLNGDGRADVCGRGSAGVYCALSHWTSFSLVTRALAAFSDANGWRAEQFYKSIRLVDVNGDSKADVCGRGIDGILCAKASIGPGVIASAGTLLPVVSFDPIELRVTNFGDVDGWGTSESYWGTVQPGNVARTAGARWCGRGSDGIYCSN